MLFVPAGARCLCCDYELFGLERCRCPECGRPFDPGNRETMRFDRTLPWRRWLRAAARFGWQGCLLLLPLGATWWGYRHNDLGTLLAMFIIPVWLYQRRWASLVLAAALSPVTMLNVYYAHAYATGQYPYVVHREFLEARGSIDRTTRCFRPDVGCGTRGSPVMYYVYNDFANAAVECGMCMLFGPPPGSYTGAHPTEAEAVAAARSGATVRVEDMTHESVHVGGKTVVRVNGYYQLRGSTGEEPIRATVWKGDCLILRVPQYDEREKKYWPARVALIDLATGSQFALYFDPQPRVAAD